MRRLSFIACTVLLAIPAGAAPLYLTGDTMGTTYAVTVARPPAALDRARVRREVEATLARVDEQASTWRTDSELSRFNDDRSTAWHAVSPDLAAVVAEALRASRLSDGAFDPTVMPLVDLWGFGPHAGTRRPPPADAIRSVRARVGFAHLTARRAPPALRKDLPELRLDLSAIAKGFAVDRVAERLGRLGADDVLVEIGGEACAHGRNSDGAPWTIAVQRPNDAPGAASAVLHVTDAAVATSGDYRHHFEWQQVRYGHVIDPRTGAPVAHGLASVTVVAGSAMRADALATALLVLGPRDGLALARRERVAALFITREDDRFRARSTRELRTYMTR